ncbi:ubiquinol oxidase subunit II [Buchnera aphidicola (Taiwanaphis decaspermi)]|uniref:ubiquinol oxidase subunit II n=1 Tax=Buchnera aphidicola TaxID=9 RepID=UPI0031B7F86F
MTFKNICIIIFMLLSTISNSFASIFDPKGYISIYQKNVFIYSFFIMLIVVIPAIIMSLYFAIKYNENKNNKYSPNWNNSFKLELIIWGIPIIIIIFLSYISLISTHKIEPSKNIHFKNVKPLEIEVIALDWKWLFVYPKENVFTINQIVIPVNTPIKLKITSENIMNSFFIPSLGSQIYAMPNMYSKLNLMAKYTGCYEGISSNYSGKGFSNMKFITIVTPNKLIFKKWLIKTKKYCNRENITNIFHKSENHPIEYFSYKLKNNIT